MKFTTLFCRTYACLGLLILLAMPSWAQKPLSHALLGQYGNTYFTTGNDIWGHAVRLEYIRTLHPRISVAARVGATWSVQRSLLLAADRMADGDTGENWRDRRYAEAAVLARSALMSKRTGRIFHALDLGLGLAGRYRQEETPYEYAFASFSSPTDPDRLALDAECAAEAQVYCADYTGEFTPGYPSERVYMRTREGSGLDVGLAFSLGYRFEVGRFITVLEGGGSRYRERTSTWYYGLNVGYRF